MKRQQYLWGMPAILLIFLTGCATTGDGEEYSYPSWVRQIPAEEGYYHGIGTDPDLSRAKQLAIMDVGMQFSTQVKSVVMEHALEDAEGTRRFLKIVDEQLTDQVVYGVKFADQFEDEGGLHWVLARAPLDCMLDVTEGFLLSYRLEVRQAEIPLEEVVKTLDSRVEDRSFRRMLWTHPDAAGDLKVYSPPPDAPAADIFANTTLLADIRKIRIDGKMDDWEGVPDVWTDPEGDLILSGDFKGADLVEARAATDGKTLYLMIRTADGRHSVPQMVYTVHLGLDPTILVHMVPGEQRHWVNRYFSKDNNIPWDSYAKKIRYRGGEVFEVALPLEPLLENSKIGPETRLMLDSIEISDGWRELDHYSGNQIRLIIPYLEP